MCLFVCLFVCFVLRMFNCLYLPGGGGGHLMVNLRYHNYR